MLYYNKDNASLYEFHFYFSLIFWDLFKLLNDFFLFNVAQKWGLTNIHIDQFLQALQIPGIEEHDVCRNSRNTRNAQQVAADFGRVAEQARRWKQINKFVENAWLHRVLKNLGVVFRGILQELHIFETTFRRVQLLPLSQELEPKE